MKKVLILAAVLMLFAAGTANAAIDGSRHDMGAMGGSYSTLVGDYGDCSACHLPHKALGAKLWAEDMSGKTFDATFGTLAVLCSYCHDGTTISAAVSANLGYGPFASAISMSAHGMNVTLTPTNGTGGGGQADVEGSGLPYTATGRPGGDYMECTSCHDVHNANSNRPFLSVGGAGDIGLANLCNTCHTGRMSTGAGTGNTNGYHPNDNIGTVTGDITGAASPIVLTDMLAFPAGIGASGDTAWDSGPKMPSTTATAGIHCVSCHVIHGDEPNTYAEDSTAASGFFDAALLLSEQLVNTNPGPAYRNQFCETCHQGDGTLDASPAGEYPNPGDTPAGTTAGNEDPQRTWHPADAGLENGAGRVVSITEPAGFPFGGGAGGDTVCTSCHAAHGIDSAGTATKAATPMLRAVTAAAGASFCQYCHTPANMGATGDCFHLGHASDQVDGSGGAIGSMSPTLATGTSWGTAVGVDCNVCHRAHNAPYAPILRAEFSLTSGADPDAICVDCHTVNPSTFTTAGSATSTASHFVGDPRAAAGAPGTYEANGYGIAAANVDGFPIPESVRAWTVGDSPIYGGTLSGAGRGNMTCLSCHTVGYCGEGAAGTRGETGDADSNYMIATASGNPVDIPGGTGQAVAVGDLGYLCSACHGTDPLTEITGSETGFTHPTITANANASSVTFAAGFGGTPTASNQLNCESCHRAHDADTESGTYILETTATGTSVTGSGTAQTIMPGHAHDVFCIGCHTY